MNFLLPFNYEFFRNGFFAAVIVGALCGFIGVYVVLRRMSYIAMDFAPSLAAPC
jgi:manganese/iron transport system permease protein/iron/zinc/copper transport system permease protein